MIDVAFLIRPTQRSLPSDSRNEDEIAILCAETFELFEKSRVISGSIGVAQIQFVLQPLLSGMLQDASNRSYSNAASKKYRGLCHVFVQRERSLGAAYHELCTESSGLQSVFKDRFAHTCNDHYRFLFLGPACQREGPEIIGFASLLRPSKNKINMLPGSKFKVAVIRLEPESHGARGNLLTIN